MSRQRLILTLVFGLLLLALGYAYWATPRQQKVAAKTPTKAAEKRGSDAKAATSTPQGTLRLDLLQREDEEFSGSKRDLFSLRKAPPPPPPMPPPIQMPVQSLLPSTPAVDQEAGAVARALGQFTFLGFLQKDGAKTLFLSSQGEIFVAKKGDAFGKQKEFVITDVSAETLTIRQGSGPGVITVSLKEQQPLAPAPSRPQPQRSGLPPMIIQPLPEDLNRQAAEGGLVEAVPEEAQEQAEADQEEQEEQEDLPQPVMFGPQRLEPPAEQQPDSTIPAGAPSPQGLQFPGMNPGMN
ncbi:MAG: hypothetical protein ACYDAI_11395 [Trichloromonadaceae bacterium]